jgi:hypothetical protein
VAEGIYFQLNLRPDFIRATNVELSTFEPTAGRYGSRQFVARNLQGHGGRSRKVTRPAPQKLSITCLSACATFSARSIRLAPTVALYLCFMTLWRHTILVFVSCILVHAHPSKLEPHTRSGHLNTSTNDHGLTKLGSVTQMSQASSSRDSVRTYKSAFLDVARYPVAPPDLKLEQVHVYVRHGASEYDSLNSTRF